MGMVPGRGGDREVKDEIGVKDEEEERKMAVWVDGKPGPDAETRNRKEGGKVMKTFARRDQCRRD